MDTALLRNWLTLYERKKELDAALAVVAEQLAAIDDKVKEQFTEAGCDKITLDGRTVYVACDRWPKAKDGGVEALTAALKLSPYHDVVKEKYNAQTLRSLTNEMIRLHLAKLSPAEKLTFTPNDAVPVELQPYLEISEVFSVKARKS